jgi:MFS family permease
MTDLGTSIGPFVGGALAQNHWRWIFYLNLPIGGVALGFLFIFLHVKGTKQNFWESFKRFDFVGSFLSISSTVAILFALTYAGAVYPWSSWRVIVPLVLGLAGLTTFHIYEATGFPIQALIPPHLFANRTSAVAFFATFIHATIFVWVIYFLPVYFQAVLLSSPTRSGVQLLPTVTAMIPFAIVAAVIVEKTGKYKPVHFGSIGLMAVGTGLMALLKENSSTGLWAGLQLIVTAGLGGLVPALLPAVQAGLTDADNSSSTATWAYVRSFGAVWGVTIPAAIFNNQVSKHVDEITNPQVREVFSNGNAYEHGNKAFITSLDSTSQRQVIHVFVQSLKIVWIVGMILCVINFLLVFLEKSIELRKDLDSKFGLEDRPDAKTQEGEKVPANATGS